MLKASKKILSVLMVILMVITAVPLSGFVGLELPDFDLDIRASAKTVSASGSCGPNVTYTYNSSTGELVISGEGPMNDYSDSYSYRSPFYDSDIKSVVISDGVTTIGNYAFYSCDYLTSITIPNSVTSIGDLAFYYCTNLTSVTIPDSVTTIGSNAFYYCTSLTSATIGAGVTSMGDSFFYNCYNLTELTIRMKEIPARAFQNFNTLKTVKLSEGIEKIGDYAFSGCSLLETIEIPGSVTYIGSNIMSNTAWYNYQNAGLIVLDDWIYGYKGDMPENYTLKLDKNTRGVVDGFFNSSNNITAFDVASDNQFFSSVDGVLFNKDMTTILRYPMSRTDMQYTIPSTVTQIGTGAFYNCSNLLVVDIPENLQSIGNYAFYNCYILADANIPDTVSYIGSYAFYNCHGLTNINIPSSITTIQPYSFAYCHGITELAIPDNTTSIGEYAFYNCSNLVNLKLGNGVETIESYAFADCGRLKNVIIPDNVKQIGSYVFSYGNKDSITIGTGVTEIGYGIDNWKNVYYAGSQEEWNKISIYYPNFNSADLYLNHTHSYTTEIIENATCTTEGSVRYTCVHGESYTDVIPMLQHSWSEWDYNDLGQLYRTCSVCNTQKRYGTANMDNFIVSNLKATNTSCRNVLLEWDKVEGASIYRIYIRYGNNSYNSWNYYTTSSNSYEFNLSSEYDIVSFKVEAGYYDDYEMYYKYGEYTELANHQYISKHNFISEISPATISNSGNEKKICTVCGYEKGDDYIPQIRNIYLSNSTVTYNGKARTPSVKVRNYHWEMLTNKVSYTYEYLDGEMKDPGVYRVKVTFKNRYAGEEILLFTILPSNINNFTTTGKYITADLNWDDVEGADIYRVYKTKNNRTTLIGTTTESNFKVIGLKPGTKYKVSVEAGTDIGNGEYIWGKRETKYVTTTSFPLCDHVDENGDRICDICGDEALMYAGNYADTIFRLYVDGTLVISGTGTAYCRWSKYREFIKKVVVEEDITSLAAGCFALCTNLEEVSLPSTLETIGSEAFYSCEKLPSIDIPDSVTRFGNSVFSGCVLFESLTIPEGVTELRYYFASGCTALKQIDLPSTIEELGDGAFADCTALETIELPEGLKRIYGSFKYCSNLKNITLPSTLESIAYEAFADCDSLTDITFPDSLKEIGDYAFDDCDGFKEIYIPSTVESVGYLAFAKCDSLEKAVTGAAYLTDCIFGDDDKLVEVEFIEGTKEISWNCFENCDNLSELKFSDTVESIGYRAFAECMSLVEVTLPESLKSIGNYAFYRCHNLKTVDFANVNKIEKGAFEDCIRLENVELGKGTEYIGTDAFKNCIRLQSVTVYNPDCQIDSYRDTLPENALLCGYDYSTLEKYADDWMRSFTVIGGEHTHRYSEKITTQATCEESGVRTFSCPCGDSYTESIDAPGHKKVAFGGKAATCTENGLSVGTKCQRCNKVFVAEEIIPATGHNMIADAANSINATCTDNGVLAVVCTVCGIAESQTINAIGHNMVNGKCIACGYGEAKECDCNCHKGGISGLLFKLILFFQKFLRMNKTCECGIEHY